METYSCIEFICEKRIAISFEYKVDALLAHNVDRAIRELRTVKNESKSLKKDLIVQMTNSGEYHMPSTIDQPSSAIKSIIAAQISFINT